MKKKSLQTLQLNKKSISNLRGTHLTGGSSYSDTICDFNCRLTNESYCDCQTEGCNNRTIEECDIQASEIVC